MNSIGLSKWELDTPCLAIDLARLDRNIATVHGRIRAAGKQARPHAKSHKCSTLARRQIEAGAVGVCAAKLSEAEALADAGVRNILITAPIPSRVKMDRLVALLQRQTGVMAVIDSADNAERLSGVLSASGLAVEVLIDVDVGLFRTGVAPAKALEFARHVAGLGALRVRGIQAYAGQVQHIQSYSGRERASLDCLRKAAEAFRQMKAAGLPCEVFSAAGTGTYDIDLAIPELTELQVGSYVLMDMEYLALTAARDRAMFEELAPPLSLLTTVVSANQQGFVTVDAGMKSLYRHGGVPRVVSPDGIEYVYDWFGDEYGKISFPVGVKRPSVGTVFELVVSHCDPTVNLFDRYHVCRGETVVEVWPIDLRGRSQ